MLNDWQFVQLSKDTSLEKLSKDLTIEFGPAGETWFIFDSHLYLRLNSKELTWYMLKYGTNIR